MTQPKPATKEQPSPFTMDDIARRFLSTPPAPHKPPVKAAAKKVRKPAKK